MADLAPFPDIEELLTRLLAEFAATGSVYPAALEEQLPFVRVQRRSGDDDRVTDTPLVDVEVASASRAEAWQIARSIQQRLITGPLHIPQVGVMDRARTQIGPRSVLHENQRIRCVLATYSVSARRLT